MIVFILSLTGFLSEASLETIPMYDLSAPEHSLSVSLMVASPDLEVKAADADIRLEDAEPLSVLVLFFASIMQGNQEQAGRLCYQVSGDNKGMGLSDFIAGLIKDYESIRVDKIFHYNKSAMGFVRVTRSGQSQIISVPLIHTDRGYRIHTKWLEFDELADLLHDLAWNWNQKNTSVSNKAFNTRLEFGNGPTESLSLHFDGQWHQPTSDWVKGKRDTSEPVRSFAHSALLEDRRGRAAREWWDQASIDQIHQMYGANAEMADKHLSEIAKTRGIKDVLTMNLGEFVAHYYLDQSDGRVHCLLLRKTDRGLVMTIDLFYNTQRFITSETLCNQIHKKWLEQN